MRSSQPPPDVYTTSSCHLSESGLAGIRNGPCPLPPRHGDIDYEVLNTNYFLIFMYMLDDFSHR